ncbi:hypothetical protein A1O1_00979 [Capronia coronata CBS 617.96]|uniref:Uncharacterized protein n=1 Tax=Capronia coronata CBS 617.96 TaxID=1182541 RepID=W9ZN27_9EURO|nr:uncharacterized protein A1O1_00979 [Capronia coronata CBS 617.96]EXJ95854.1 hypothetical protein A1O1_00979 [Capronia coronata CBS 617.96]
MAPREVTKKSHVQPSRVVKSIPCRVGRKFPPAVSRPRARTTTAVHRSSVSTVRAHQTNGDNNIGVSIRLTAASPQNAVLDRLRHDSTSEVSDQRALTGPRWVLSLPPLGERSTPGEVRHFLDAIADYFGQWSSHDQLVGPASFFGDMNVIIGRMEEFASLPSHIRSYPVVSRALVECEKQYELFASLWARAARRGLCDKLATMNASLSSSLSLVRESDFTALLEDIRVISTPPGFSSRAEAGQNVAVLLSQDDARDATLLCEALHYRFQNATYKTETKRLWVLVWQGLKTAFLAYQEHGSAALPQNSSVELSFFSDTRVVRRLRLLTQSPDAANPRTIEEMVGHYCRYIADCHAKSDNKFAHLRGLRNEPLKAHVLASLQKFIETGKLETSTLPKLHFAVIRLNAISGGAKVLRRWKEGPSSPGWQACSPQAHGHPAKAPVTWAEISSEAPDKKPGSGRQVMNHTSYGARQSFPHPEGVNRRSAFDYVWYPFPETRAHEVAQNEQITREMAEPGMYSDGPRAAFLVNRPPRHARNPADVSRFTSKRRTGPLGWIGQLLQKHLSERHRRRAMKMRAPKLAKLSPAVKDPNARVHKAPAPALKIRGGGGMARDPFRKPLPSKPLLSNRPRVDSRQFRREHIERLKDALYDDGENPLTLLDLQDDQLLPLLEQACYNIHVAAELYHERGPAPTHAQSPSQKATGHITAGTRRPSQKATGTSQPQAQRQPLGELPVQQPEGSEDGQSHGNNENDAGMRADSNDENRAPTSTSTSSNHHVDGPCHPCPQYPGQYHHNCRCPFEPHASGDVEEDSSPENPPSVVDEDSEGEEPAVGEARRHQQIREQPHPDDERSLRSLFASGSQLHWEVAEASDIFDDLEAFFNQRYWEHDAKVRSEIRDMILALRKQTQSIVAAYLSGIDQSVPVFMESIPAKEKLRYNPGLPSSKDLCHRCFFELQRHFYRMSDMMDVEQRYTNLGFRHALCRCIRSIRELTRVYEEYYRHLDGNSSPPADESTDSEATLSEDEKQRMVDYKPRPRPVLPTRQEYDMMFKDELQRELVDERGFVAFPPRYTKDWLIAKLMELDQQGNFGCGARHGYRNLANNPGARARPRGFDLEAAIAVDKNTRYNLKDDERRRLKEARKLKRQAQGLPSSIDRGETPGRFSQDVDESSDESRMDSEYSSTTSAP